MSDLSHNRMLQVTAQMVASVATVHAQRGQPVSEGDTLLVVESMKMKIPVLAPAAGTVVDIRVGVADIIQEGDILVLIDTDGAETR